MLPIFQPIMVNGFGLYSNYELQALKFTAVTSVCTGLQRWDLAPSHFLDEGLYDRFKYL